MPQVTQNGNSVDFQTGPFYDYCKMREGYKLYCYDDKTGTTNPANPPGNPTIGIGHLVTDGTALGTVITEAQVQQYYNSDYANLNIEQYVTETPASGTPYTLNQMLCIGHFIWLHGPGDYATSAYRQNWLNNTYPNEADQQAYLTQWWDTGNSRIQRVNAADCHVAYQANDWSAGIGDQIAWQLDDTFPTFSGWCQANQVWVSIALVVIIALLFYYFVTHLK